MHYSLLNNCLLRTDETERRLKNPRANGTAGPAAGKYVARHPLDIAARSIEFGRIHGVSTDSPIFGNCLEPSTAP